MTTNMHGARNKPAPKAPPPPARPAEVYVGQTFRVLHLTAGPRPFAVVKVDTDADTASGWLMLDPKSDSEDPLLKALGIQAADRQRPCYITVRTDQVK